MSSQRLWRAQAPQGFPREVLVKAYREARARGRHERDGGQPSWRVHLGMPTDHVLNLWKRNLGSIPEEVWNNPDISALILADNNLEEVSPRIGELQRLRTLDLGHNRLTKLPDEIGDLVRLGDFLYVHDNQLHSLPESIGRLQKL